jgi:hypothetical protein
MHRDDADRAGVAEGSGGHGWAGERHHRHAPAPPAPRKGREAQRSDSSALARCASRGRTGGVIASDMNATIVETRGLSAG